MSAQGTITGRTPVHLPVRGIAVAIAAALAAVLTIGVIELSGPAKQVNVDNVTRDTMPVQRLYPGGFGAQVTESGDAEAMPVQRLYPDGFGVKATDDGYTRITSGVRRKLGR